MKSQYADRDTVGTIYLKAQKTGFKGLLTGDVNSEMVPDFVKDMNRAIYSNPFEGKPFYINITEKRDAQMQNAFRRKIIKTLYRPFPEFSTYALYTKPREERTFYCWDLPHHTEMINVLSEPHKYDRKYVLDIMNWKNNELAGFGFLKVSMSSRHVEGYDKKVINSYKKHYSHFCKYVGMDEKAVETEKRYGFFWIPNKNFKDLLVSSHNPVISTYSAA